MRQRLSRDAGASPSGARCHECVLETRMAAGLAFWSPTLKGGTMLRGLFKRGSRDPSPSSKVDDGHREVTARRDAFTPASPTKSLPLWQRLLPDPPAKMCEIMHIQLLAGALARMWEQRIGPLHERTGLNMYTTVPMSGRMWDMSKTLTRFFLGCANGLKGGAPEDVEAYILSNLERLAGFDIRVWRADYVKNLGMVADALADAGHRDAHTIVDETDWVEPVAILKLWALRGLATVLLGLAASRPPGALGDVGERAFTDLRETTVRLDALFSFQGTLPPSEVDDSALGLDALPASMGALVDSLGVRSEFRRVMPKLPAPAAPVPSATPVQEFDILSSLFCPPVDGVPPPRASPKVYREVDGEDSGAMDHVQEVQSLLEQAREYLSGLDRSQTDIEQLFQRGAKLHAKVSTVLREIERHAHSRKRMRDFLTRMDQTDSRFLQRYTRRIEDLRTLLAAKDIERVPPASTGIGADTGDTWITVGSEDLNNSTEAHDTGLGDTLAVSGPLDVEMTRESDSESYVGDSVVDDTTADIEDHLAESGPLDTRMTGFETVGTDTYRSIVDDVDTQRMDASLERDDTVDMDETLDLAEEVDATHAPRHADDPVTANADAHADATTVGEDPATDETNPDMWDSLDRNDAGDEWAEALSKDKTPLERERRIKFADEKQVKVIPRKGWDTMRREHIGPEDTHDFEAEDYAPYDAYLEKQKLGLDVAEEQREPLQRKARVNGWTDPARPGWRPGHLGVFLEDAESDVMKDMGIKDRDEAWKDPEFRRRVRKIYRKGYGGASRSSAGSAVVVAGCLAIAAVSSFMGVA